MSVSATPRRVVVVGVTALLLVAALALALVTRAWAEDHRAGDRLLAGTVVAGLDVGEATAEEATDVVAAELDSRLDAGLTIAAGDFSWDTTARELGATADPDAAVAEAVEASAAAGWSDLAAIRWLDADGKVNVDADPLPDAERIAIAVASYAAEIEQDPADATALWSGGSVEVAPHKVGRTVDRGAAEQAIEDAIVESQDVAEVPVDEEPAAVVQDDLDGVRDALQTAADTALDHVVELVHGDETWELSAREIGARPRVEEMVESALELDGSEADAAALTEELVSVPLEIDEAALEPHLEEIADAVAVSPVNADIDYSSGWVELTGSSEGRALDREAAEAAVLEALQGGEVVVELSTNAVAPERTRDDFRDVLLVRQNERRLYHYRDGDIVADWPIAIGTSEQPTPTGRFTVGHKRHMPTWHNPATDGWGADMPDVVEPGPDNPLGVRAMNWNRGGADTLIRFHGTSNTGSIGQATSNGCVRLTNSDVIELFDRIPTGTAIVSVHG